MVAARATELSSLLALKKEKKKRNVTPDIVCSVANRSITESIDETIGLKRDSIIVDITCAHQLEYLNTVEYFLLQVMGLRVLS